MNKITHKNKVFIKTLSYISLVRPATRRMKNKWSHRQASKQALKQAESTN